MLAQDPATHDHIGGGLCQTLNKILGHPLGGPGAHPEGVQGVGGQEPHHPPRPGSPGVVLWLLQDHSVFPAPAIELQPWLGSRGSEMKGKIPYPSVRSGLGSPHPRAYMAS